MGERRREAIPKFSIILPSVSLAAGQGSLSRATRMQSRTSEGKFQLASIQASFTASAIKPLSTTLTAPPQNAPRQYRD
jgi:hypothetical protein